MPNMIWLLGRDGDEIYFSYGWMYTFSWKTLLDKRLSFEEIRRFSRSFNKDPRNVLALNAVTENGIAAVALSRKEVDRQNFTFSNLIESPDATNQERSGRCWLFSGLSTLSLEAMKKLKLRTFELSEIYQMFWDKLEKANYFLENVIETKEEPLNGRLVSSLLSDPIPDGGEWNMFVNLIEKYGVIPKNVHARDSQQQRF